MKPFIIIICFSIAFAGCAKEYQEIPYDKLETGYSFTLRDIAIIDTNKWIVCGGDNGFGMVLQTTDRGSTWIPSLTSFDNSINCIKFLNSDTGFAGDSDILIYKTIDGGHTWNPFYASSWPLSVNRYLRDIWFINDSTGFVCGGKNFGNGVLFHTNNGGDYWNFREFNHEYRGICFVDQLNGVMCGYGSLLHTSNGGISFELTNNDKAYFTGICHDSYLQYWVCDFNGAVMKSSDKGKTWSTHRKSPSSKFSTGQLNCIDVSPSGKIAAAGPNGFLTWSNDFGHTWNDRESFGGKDVFKIKWVSDHEIAAVGVNGGVYLIRI
jgi:photosystem II stability/assembly factor-like uncharacterized protein